MIDLDRQLRDYYDAIINEVRAGTADAQTTHRRWWAIAGVAAVVTLVAGITTVFITSPNEPATTSSTSATVTTIAQTTSTLASTTTVAPSTTLPATLQDLEAAAVNAVAGAGTMLIHEMSEWGTHRGPIEDRIGNLILRYVEPGDLLSTVESDIYLDLAPLPETRLKDGAVWIAAFPSASDAALFISQTLSKYRDTEQEGARFPISEFEVPGIDGASGFLARWLTGRAGPSSSPNATVWFQVENVAVAVDINLGADFATAQWPIDYAVHLSRWVHASLSAQITGQQNSGPDAPVAPPPSDFEQQAVAQFEEFHRAIISGDVDAARAMVDIESPGSGCGENCQLDNWRMDRAPLFAAMLEPFDATADILGCSATLTTTIERDPGDQRDAVEVRCLLRIAGDPWLEALGISNLVESDGLVVPGLPLKPLPGLPEHPGSESAEYGLLLLATHAGGSAPETLASVCVFDPNEPDERLAWSVDTESPLRRLLEEACWRMLSGEFDDVVIPVVP